MLPVVRRHAKIAFRHLDPEAREEAVQEVVCNACCAVARLAELGKLEPGLPDCAGPLRRGAGPRWPQGGLPPELQGRFERNTCQRRKEITVERLDRYDREADEWQEILVEDRHVGPAETAAARIDVGDWMETLPPRDRQIAEALGRRRAGQRRSPGGLV